MSITRSVLTCYCWLFLALSTFGAENSATTKSEQQHQLAEDAVKRLIEAKEWREVSAIQKEFATLGEAAISLLKRQAKRHEDDGIRMRCYEVLTEYFGEEAGETIAHHGLADQSDKIRYHCAWHLGDLKIYGGHRRLRHLMEDEKQPDFVRHAATKSLAELGEANVIRRLITMLESDYYMPRHMGNLGLKALTGKDLDDFHGYEYAEGAFFSGGNEMVTAYEPISYHEKVAQRNQAIADFCVWLKDERPDIYKHLYAPW